MVPSPLFLWEVWGNFWYLLWEYGWVPESKPHRIVGAHLWHCSELNLQQFINFGSCSPIQTWLVQWFQLVTLCFHKSGISVLVCLKCWGATVFLCAFPSLIFFCFVLACRGFVFLFFPFVYLLWWQDSDWSSLHVELITGCFFSAFLFFYVCVYEVILGWSGLWGFLPLFFYRASRFSFTDCPGMFFTFLFWVVISPIYYSFMFNFFLIPKYFSKFFQN